MNSHKCKLNFMILQTNLAIGSTNFIGIMNPIHYVDNQFNSNFEPISLHVVNNFMIWYMYSQFDKINLMNYITLFHNKRYIVYKILLIAKIYSTIISIDMSYPTLDHVCSDCLYVLFNVTSQCLMILEIILSDMAYDESKYPFCIIEKWTI
jgi:hypothetical protein